MKIMRKIFLLMMVLLFCNLIFAQNKEDAEKIVGEGVAYHDKGDYDGAITKYNKALELDKDNFLALAEKAYSLLSKEEYNESILCCQKTIEKHSGEKDLKSVYVTYGNALDGLKKTDKSLEIYDEGIKLYPNYYHLYYNKGITLISIKKYEDALNCFHKSALLNPNHASTQNAIARILMMKNKRIPSLLVFSRFLIIEQTSKRVIDNLVSLQKIMKGNVEQTGKKSITINISPEMLSDTTKGAKPKENDFTSTDLILAMDAGLDFDKKNKKKTEVEQFIRKFETVCASIKETQKDNYGFYWEYYAPYFIEMSDKNFIKTFAYIAFSSSDDESISKWIKSHKKEIQDFYEWSRKFSWEAK